MWFSVRQLVVSTRKARAMRKTSREQASVEHTANVTMLSLLIYLLFDVTLSKQFFRSQCVCVLLSFFPSIEYVFAEYTRNPIEIVKD